MGQAGQSLTVGIEQAQSVCRWHRRTKSMAETGDRDHPWRKRGEFCDEVLDSSVIRKESDIIKGDVCLHKLGSENLKNALSRNRRSIHILCDAGGLYTAPL